MNQSPKLVRLLRQNSHILLRLVGRGDLILGRSRRSDESAEDTSIDSSEGVFMETKLAVCNETIWTEMITQIPRIQGDRFWTYIARKIWNWKVMLELAKGDLGSKRAMTIRDKMIEMDPAIANQVLIEGSMRSVREVLMKDDYYHVLFIRIDATCLQDYNACPYSQNSESFVELVEQQ